MNKKNIVAIALTGALIGSVALSGTAQAQYGDAEFKTNIERVDQKTQADEDSCDAINKRREKKGLYPIPC